MEELLTFARHFFSDKIEEEKEDGVQIRANTIWRELKTFYNREDLEKIKKRCEELSLSMDRAVPNLTLMQILCDLCEGKLE